MANDLSDKKLLKNLLKAVKELTEVLKKNDFVKKNDDGLINLQKSENKDIFIIFGYIMQRTP